MPMDYDDNDFEDKNHHLTSEGNSKFSPVLKPYALPKFDFSDSLHSQLRFDSLVENEGFLGIPSQEENHWIEDFSQGGGPIEFGSSAAESCSIVRHTNVWSEATSSESVEMLLKSVGQEDMVPGETIVEESEACNAFDNLTEQIDCYPSQVGAEEDNANTRIALPDDNVLGNLSGTSDTKGISQVHETEIFLLENPCCLDQNTVSERHGTYLAEENVASETKCDTANITELSAEGLLYNETGKHPRHGTYLAEENVVTETKCDTANITELSAEGLLYNETGKHPSDGMKIDGVLVNSIFSSQKAVPSYVEEAMSSDVVLNHQESLLPKGEIYPSSDMGDEVTRCLPSDKEDDKDDTSTESAVDKGKCASDNIPHLPSDGDSGEIRRTNSVSQEPTCIPLDGNHGLQKTQDFGENACSKDSDESCDKRLEETDNAGAEIQHKANTDNLLTVFSSDNQDSHNHADDSNSIAGTCISSEMKMEPTKYFLNYPADEKKNLQGQDEQLDNKAPLLLSVESSAAPRNFTELLGEKQVHGSGEIVINICGIHEEHLNAKDSVSPYTQADNLQIAKGNTSGEEKDDTSPVESSIAPRNVTELLGEKQVHGSGEGVINVCGIHEECLNAKDSVSLYKQAEILEIAKGSNSSGKEEDGNSPNETKIIRSPGESANMEADHIRSYGGEDRVMSEPDGKALESESIMEADHIRSYGGEDRVMSEPDGKALESESIMAFEASGVVHVTSEEQAPFLHVVPLDLDATDKPDPEVLKESNGSARISPVEELDKTISCGSSGELKQETVVQHLAIGNTYNSVVGIEQQNADDIVDQSMPVTDTFNTSNVNEQLIDAKTGSQISSDKLEVCVSCDPEVKEGSVAEVPVSPGNNRVASTVCTGGESSGKHDSGMLTVINNPNLSQNDCGEKDEVQESNDNISLLPDTVKISSTFQKQSGNGVDPSIRGLTSPSECSLKEKSNKKSLPSSVKKRASKKTVGAAASPSTPVVNQMVSKLPPDVPSGISMGHDAETLCVPKDTTERKTRRGSGKARGQDDARKGSIENEILSAKQFEKGSKSLTAPLSISGSSPLVHFDRMKSNVQVEHGSASCLTPVSTSKLPDLNTSVPPSSSFQQPFSVLQQVQLRAQIFVYGSLIQGAVPDEACMVSAFASDDGGKLIWEPLWRASLERLQGKKNHIIKSDTPVQPHSVGARLIEQQMKQSKSQATVLPSPVGRTSCKDTPSVGNSNIPLSSPLWNVSTTPFESLHSSGIPRSPFPDYHQTTTPLHPYQSPSSRNFGPSTSWLSQRLFTAPLIATPPSSTLDANARVAGRSMTETVKLTPIKEASVPLTSGPKMGGSSISASISVPDLKKDLASSVQSSGEVKSKKRKKAPISEDVAQTFLPAQTNTGAVSTSLVISTPNFVSKGNADNVVTPLLPAPFTDPKCGLRPHQTILISEDSSAKVEDSKQNAENAAALAATAVNQSLSVWNQLAKQKSSNMISETEAKLVSAVVAINAAASVARAAAAAAQVASNAALQAKLMADEALSSIGTRNSGQVSTAFLSDAVNNRGELDPAAILNGGTDGNSSSLSIIVAAKEAARRRIEAASSASRHAENLDVILKAAELAADAVAQAGKIIMMGDPLPLSQLLEAGPGGYWRIPQHPPVQVSLVSDVYRESSRAVPPKDYPSTSGTHFVDSQIVNEKQSNHALTPTSEEIHLKSMENPVVTVDGNSALNISVKKEATSNKPHRDSNSTKAILPEPGMRSMLVSCMTKDLVGEESDNQIENRIKEGCLVEVCKESVNASIAWYPATVLTLKDGKALVHYIDLKSDEGSGSGPLKEWKTLSSEGCMAPKIRIPHPITVPPLEGAKKRRREAMVDYAFSSGDRVDVWVHNCWQEGIVTQKNPNDETTFTISFPAEEKTMVVKAWHIRPTLVWCDNEWIEWSCTRGRNRLSQGDTPQVKRMRIGDSVTVTEEKKDKRSEPIDIVELPQFLPLSSSEQVFNVGKNAVDENKVNQQRTARTGLPKEGSKVIIGVPKPGKKRKFMDVSKHYVGQKDPKIVKESSNDSTKNAKKITSSQSTGGTRGWNSNIKLDEKEKKGAAESSKVNASRSGKPPSVPSRTLLPKRKKDNQVSASSAVLTTTKEEDSNNTGSDSNESGAQNLNEIGSSNTSEGGGRALSRNVVHNNRLSGKSENKGKAASHGGRRMGGGRVEVNDSDEEYGKSNFEAAEPRRSNRRIQPTSRLLEGLQSSLIVSKFPSVSHDKSHRSHHRGGGTTSKGNGNG